MDDAKIRETIDSCKFCFMCRHACPTFLATKLDSHTPRGYALLLAEIESGLCSWSGPVVDRFYQCSQCGLCREDCAYHWPEDELVRHGREEIIKAGAVPERVKTLRDRLIVPAAPGMKNKNPEVLYFPGLSTRIDHPEIVEAVISILGSLKIKWTMPDADISSGIELHELGYADEAREAAVRCAAYIKEVNPGTLLTGCAHSLKAFRELYPRLGLAISEQTRILHVSEFLEMKAKDGKLKLRKNGDSRRTGYHDPCNLGRSLGVFDEPRSLIARITGSPALELFHGREKAECCGAGSVMYITDGGIAEKVAARRLESAAEEGMELIVTACQNCKTLLSKAARARGSAIVVKDIAELVSGHMEAK